MDNSTAVTNGTTTSASTTGPAAVPATTTTTAGTGVTATVTPAPTGAPAADVPAGDSFFAGLPEEERKGFLSISPDENALRMADIKNDDERAAAQAEYAKQVNDMRQGQAKSMAADEGKKKKEK